MSKNFYLATLFIFTLSSSCFANTQAIYIQANAIPSKAGTVPQQMISLIENKKLVLFGESHGTKEMPKLFFDVVSEIAKHRDVAIALEFPVSIQTNINNFLLSGDESQITGTEFFKNSMYHSGRGSDAMLELLRNIRTLKRVSVFCIDVNPDYRADDRDLKMAHELTKHVNSSSLLMSYTGNIHSRLEKGASWNPQLRPMGFEVQELLKNKISRNSIFNVNVVGDSGSAWNCLMLGGKVDCGFHDLHSTNSVYSTATELNRYFLKEPAVTDGYESVFFIRVISASKPAVAGDRN